MSRSARPGIYNRRNRYRYRRAQAPAAGARISGSAGEKPASPAVAADDPFQPDQFIPPCGRIAHGWRGDRDGVDHTTLVIEDRRSESVCTDLVILLVHRVPLPANLRQCFAENIDVRDRVGSE